MAISDSASTIPNLNTWLVTGAVIIGLLTAILGLVAATRAKKTAAKVEQITVSVDGQMSGMLLRIDQLLATMHKEGVTIPPPLSKEEVASAIRAKNGEHIETANVGADTDVDNGPDR
jgi:hypothetical protein